MKYKLEIWKYDYFSWREAEEHLNQMAKKGYRFIGTNQENPTMVYYEKCPEGTRKRYAIDIHYEYNLERIGEYYQIYKDSGWSLISNDAEEYGGFCIFETDEKSNSKPPYYDQVSREELMNQRLREKGKLIGKWMNAILYIVLAVAFWWILRERMVDTTTFFMKVSVGGVFGIALLMGGVTLAEAIGNRNHIKRSMGIDEFMPLIQRPRWINQCRIINLYISLGITIALWINCVVHGVINLSTGLWFNAIWPSGLLAILAPLMILFGVYADIHWKKPQLSNGLMTMATMLVIIAAPYL